MILGIVDGYSLVFLNCWMWGMCAFGLEQGDLRQGWLGGLGSVTKSWYFES